MRIPDFRFLCLTAVLSAYLMLMPLPAMAGLFGPSNKWECILEEMPGTQNNVAAVSIRRSCDTRFSEQGKWSKSFFGPKTFDECVAKYAKNTLSKTAVINIRMACKYIVQGPPKIVDYAEEFKEFRRQSEEEKVKEERINKILAKRKAKRNREQKTLPSEVEVIKDWQWGSHKPNFLYASTYSAQNSTFQISCEKKINAGCYIQLYSTRRCGEISHVSVNIYIGNSVIKPIAQCSEVTLSPAGPNLELSKYYLYSFDFGGMWNQTYELMKAGSQITFKLSDAKSNIIDETFSLYGFTAAINRVWASLPQGG